MAFHNMFVYYPDLLNKRLSHEDTHSMITQLRLFFLSLIMEIFLNQLQLIFHHELKSFYQYYNLQDLYHFEMESNLFF